MAYFDYDSDYTNKELYDWVLTEIAVARELNLTSLAICLDHYQKMLYQRNTDQSKETWIPSLPSQANIGTIKSRMARSSCKILHSLGAQGETSTAAEVDIAFTSQSGKCPECLEFKQHLKAHLMSSRHGWTEASYDRWKKSKVNTKEVPVSEKNCYHVSAVGVKCSWHGNRLDMHLKTSHGMTPKHSNYTKLMSSGKTPRLSSTTTSHHQSP